MGDRLPEVQVILTYSLASRSRAATAPRSLTARAGFFKHIEAISEPMRELIEDLWPELANKLPPKTN